MINQSLKIFFVALCLKPATGLISIFLFHEAYCRRYLEHKQVSYLSFKGLLPSPKLMSHLETEPGAPSIFAKIPMKHKELQAVGPTLNVR